MDHLELHDEILVSANSDDATAGGLKTEVQQGRRAPAAQSSGPSEADEQRVVAKIAAHPGPPDMEEMFGGSELCRKIGDGVNQAADLISATASIPSLNFIPLTTFGNWF
jgi:hypothetical protein